MLSISTFSFSSTFDVKSDAFQDLLQKQLDRAKKNAAAIDGLSRRADLDQKALARQRVKEIKEQIESLRRMLMLFGGKDAKAVLQQLKQLASQLKQAADILKTPSGSSVSDTAASTSVPDAGTEAPATETTDAYAEGRNAYAAQQASADADAIQVPSSSYDAQGEEDAKQVEAVSQSLKALRAMLEKQVRKQEHHG
jgi:DNA-binding FrmR family transcriptional regulator